MIIWSICQISGSSAISSWHPSHNSLFEGQYLKLRLNLSKQFITRRDNGQDLDWVHMLNQPSMFINEVIVSTQAHPKVGSTTLGQDRLGWISSNGSGWIWSNRFHPKPTHSLTQKMPALTKTMKAKELLIILNTKLGRQVRSGIATSTCYSNLVTELKLVPNLGRSNWSSPCSNLTAILGLVTWRKEKQMLYLFFSFLVTQ